MPIARKMAVLLAVLLAYVTPALADAGTTNGAPTASATAFNFDGLYTDGAGKDCANMTYCAITLSAIPATKIVTILNVSCFATFTGPGLITDTILGAAAHNTYLEPALVSVSGTTRRYSLNNAAYEPYPAAFKPTIAFNTSAVETSIHLECTIEGTIR